MKLNCYPASTSTSAAIYFNGLPDYWEMKFILHYLKPGDNFLDIGANAGVYTILAAACVGENGSVDAFEPMDTTARWIEGQISLNKLRNVEVHRLAAGDKEQIVEFGYARDSSMMHMKRAGEPADTAVRVQSVRLDSFKPRKHYAMAKMDIEGAEPLALQGAANKLRHANPPVWLLELAGYSQHYGMRSDEVLDLLRSAGYDCAVYASETRQLVFTDRPWELDAQNVLAVSSAHKDMVLRRIQTVDAE